MEYAGFLLRRERLARNWSQEGLCKNICTVSYLSKIEQGKAEPSGEILKLLMERMELRWYGSDPEGEAFIEAAYEALFAHEKAFGPMIAQADKDRFRYSPWGPDFLLLERFASAGAQPLEEELEACLDNRQLALQRLLQGRYDEAVRLHPRAFFSSAAGEWHYRKGEVSAALEALQNAYQMAAQEGCPRVMLYCKLTMGNCYSNQRNLAAMESHYRVARRLAKALEDETSLAAIAYNTAATQLEAGQYDKALSYFQTLEQPTRMDLHKLAICYEKLGMVPQALDTLDRMGAAQESEWMPEGLEAQIMDVVRMRLTDPGYLKNQRYGAVLLECFHRCRAELSSGYAVFHLPWVLEWYESNRQYKQALALMKCFPEAGGN